jgi:transglutaminase-like putative cysteine protease
MKKTCIFFAVVFFAVLKAPAQFDIYSALTIPDSLKKNADAVIRDEHIKFTVKDINSAKYEVHQVITVLNEDGKEYLSFYYHSDKFHVLDDAEIKVFDLLGQKKNTYSKKEMTSVNYGEGLVPEGKLTYFQVSAPSYPFTLEINYSVKYKGVLGYPSYNFQIPYQSVQHSVFEVEAPADLSFRYKILNCNYQPVITKNDKNDQYRWEVKHLAAYKSEKHSGASENYIAKLLLAPNKFQLDEYDGDMTSWKNYGDWMNKLYEKTTELKEDRKLFYLNLVKDAKTDREKVAILYNYLQGNMRYVSIQLGIGGWRPFTASFVDEKKYGDCKALSNYMRSALDAVGVPSNIIVIYRDYIYSNVDEKFPMNAFNHVILAVPQPKDTIWLECTSTTLPFAYLDETTLNRKAVMVTGNGGVLVNTPRSNYKNNVESVTTVIDVSEAVTAKVNVQYQLQGENRDRLLMRFHDMKDDEKRKYFISGNEWKQPDFVNITTSDSRSNPYIVSAAMEYEKIFSFKAGSKYFLEPRLYPIFNEDIPETEKRKSDYYFSYPYQNADTTVYNFPDGFTVESLPKDKSVNLPFAAYTCTYKWDADKHILTTIAVLQIKERVVKAADYSKLLDFKKQVMADVNEKIVMKKG